MNHTMCRLLILVLPVLAHLLTTASATSGSEGPPFRLIQSTKPAYGSILGGCGGNGNLIHLRLFWHNIGNGQNPTVVTVAYSATANASATSFGTVKVMDDPLTVAPDLSSRLVGRAQGMYVSADQKMAGLLMAMNFVFEGGKYSGSTLAVMGRNQVTSHVREMPIVGGSGLFRFARGYVLATTFTVDPKSGNAIVEYNCFILQYCSIRELGISFL